MYTKKNSIKYAQRNRNDHPHNRQTPPGCTRLPERRRIGRYARMYPSRGVLSSNRDASRHRAFFAEWFNSSQRTNPNDWHPFIYNRPSTHLVPVITANSLFSATRSSRSSFCTSSLPTIRVSSATSAVAAVINFVKRFTPSSTLSCFTNVGLCVVTPVGHSPV